MKWGRFHPRGDRPLAFHAASFVTSFGEAPSPNPAYEVNGNASIVTIRGPLVQHDSAPEIGPYGMPGPTWDSYDSIVGRVRAAAEEPKTTAVILKIDSPGGDALGCFEAARAIRKICASAGKTLWAFGDGLIASAAYALACSAPNGIFIPLAGLAGSVGILMTMLDTTRADAAMGLRFVMITSGARKLDSNPHVPISEESLVATQAKCDELAGLFFSFVEEMRPTMDAKKIAALEGECLYGQRAVAAGLADGIAEWGDFLGMVAKATPGTTTARDDTKEAKAMKMSKEMRAALAEMGKDESDAGAMARGLLAAFPEEKEEGDEKKDGEKKEGKAEEKKDAKASDEKKEEAKAEEDKKARAKAEEDKDAKAKAEGSAMAIAQRALERAQALETQLTNERESTERSKLLASRADFSKEVLSDLGSMPLAFVKHAVETWPRPAGFPAAALGVPVTQGAPHNGSGGAGGGPVVGVSREESALIEAKMGRVVDLPGTRNIGKTLELGQMTDEQAQKRLAELTKLAGKVA